MAANSTKMLTGQETLLYDIMSYYYTQHSRRNRDFSARSNLFSDFRDYEWNRSDMKMIKKLLSTRIWLRETHCLQYDTLRTLFEEGKTHLLFLYLKCGVLNPQILKDYPYVKNQTKAYGATRTFMYGFPRVLRLEQMKASFGIYESPIQNEFLRMLGRYPWQSQRRLSHALFGLEAIITDDYSRISPHYKVLCLKILYDFLPEPHITSTEIRKIVQCIRGQSASGPLERQVGDIFEEYFPESKQMYQPRSLQHLSRCEIRRTIRESGKFGDVAKKLPLPKTLIAYVFPPNLPEISTENIAFLRIDNLLQL